MKDNVKRVFYVRYIAHSCYLDIIGQRPEIRLDKLENETADDVARPIMAAAHAYQIGSARDELKPRFHVQRDLLARMPNLLIVSTNGAGFDTVNVKDCTDAGVLVVNQTGGNAEAVATHVLAMVLMLSKQIIQTNHALRRGTMLDRTVFMGNDVKGRTIGIVGIGNVGRRVAELCRGLFGMQVIACDPYLDEQTVAARGAVKVTLDELLRRADFVSINCPLDESTRGMIGAREFALMQPHAYFITTARRNSSSRVTLMPPRAAMVFSSRKGSQATTCIPRPRQSSATRRPTLPMPTVRPFTSLPMKALRSAIVPRRNAWLV
jgi:D-3-phosphoglycerate dehydrogenase / 2-oxoglutarate reductase